MPFLETLSGSQLDALGQRESVAPLASHRPDAFDATGGARIAATGIWSDEADRLLRIAVQITRRREDAEDVLSDSWIELVALADDGKLKDSNHAKQMAYRIVRLRSIDAVRRRKLNVEPEEADVCQKPSGSRLAKAAIAWILDLCSPSERRALDLVMELGDVALACAHMADKGSGFREAWKPYDFSRLFTRIRQRATGQLRQIAANRLRYTTKGTLAGWHHERYEAITSVLSLFSRLTGNEPEPEPVITLTLWQAWQLAQFGAVYSLAVEEC